MFYKDYLKRKWIQFCRYLLQQKYLPIMNGPLKGYLWTTASSYEYIMGDYENPETQKTFLSWLKFDTVYYDIGANIGYHALIANTVTNQGKIYAFEPMPHVRKIFEQHISLNRNKIPINNIELLPYAVADKEKRIPFSNDKKQSDGNTFIKASPVFIHAANKMMVQCVSIDGLVAKGYARPTVIKIDAEGAELEILQGALHTLQTCKPHILLATHDCHLPGVKDKCLRLLRDLGYNVQYTGNYNKHIAGLDDYIAIYIDQA
ncbi:MAG TPA: FkbM family methyltransferase [Ferruginibacter sp.]|nr:FkbM family methyltransferase [Ferruginibacter sp.]